MPPVPSICGLLVVGALLSASEAVGGDLRLGIEMRTLAFDYVVHDGGATSTGDDRFTRSVAAGLRGWYAWPAPGRKWAPAIAADLVVSDSAADLGRLQTFGGRLLGGVAWSWNDRWGGTAFVGAGYAVSRFRIEGDGVFNDPRSGSNTASVVRWLPCSIWAGGGANMTWMVMALASNSRKTARR